LRLTEKLPLDGAEKTEMAELIQSDQEHIPELDGLRGVAISAVLAFHFSIFYLSIETGLSKTMTLLAERDRT
jgi:peptidoglycan/LPS O-acetylase OafA/YrhL